MGVTLPTFHFVGKVCLSIQKLISLHRESAIAGTAILSNLALTPSLAVALCLLLKPGDFLNITRAISLRINSCFKNTRHFIQSKEKSL